MNAPLDPAFIVGVPRSGTTLLVNLVGAHPLIAPIYETRFLRNLLVLCEWSRWFWGDSLSRRLAGILGESRLRSRLLKECEKFREKVISYSRPVPEDDGTRQSYESFPFGGILCIHYSLEELVRETDRWLDQLRVGGLSSAGVYPSARDYVDRLFAIHCSRMNKPHWINKTPGLIGYLDRLSLLYPNARCLHILRDGRDIAVSNLSLNWGPTSVRQAARQWKRLILEGRKRADPTRLRYRELRYEDLVRSPREVLREVLTFVGLDADQEKALSAIPIFNARVGVWREALSVGDRQVFAREAGDLLIELGYERDYGWVG